MKIEHQLPEKHAGLLDRKFDENDGLQDGQGVFYKSSTRDNTYIINQEHERYQDFTKNFIQTYKGKEDQLSSAYKPFFELIQKLESQTPQQAQAVVKQPEVKEQESTDQTQNQQPQIRDPETNDSYFLQTEAFTVMGQDPSEANLTELPIKLVGAYYKLMHDSGHPNFQDYMPLAQLESTSQNQDDIVTLFDLLTTQGKAIDEMLFHYQNKVHYSEHVFKLPNGMTMEAHVLNDPVLDITMYRFVREDGIKAEFEGIQNELRLVHADQLESVKKDFPLEILQQAMAEYANYRNSF